MIAYTSWQGPMQFPGACVCGSQKQPIVDTHRELPAYGHVYLCGLCVAMSASALGTFVPRDAFDQVVEERAAAVEQVAAMTLELAAALDPANRTITAGELNAWLASQQEVGAHADRSAREGQAAA